MKIGTLAFELHARVHDDQIVVSRVELDSVAAQLQRLSPLIASFGEETFGARFEIGTYCTIVEGRIEFDVIAGSEDLRFILRQFIAWCRRTGDASSVSVLNNTGLHEDLEGDGIEVLSQSDTRRILAAMAHSTSGFIDDIVESVSTAVKVTTPKRSYVMVDASIDAYVPGKMMPRPCGKPLGQLPLLPTLNPDGGVNPDRATRRQDLSPCIPNPLRTLSLR